MPDQYGVEFQQALVSLLNFLKIHTSSPLGAAQAGNPALYLHFLYRTPDRLNLKNVAALIRVRFVKAIGNLRFIAENFEFRKAAYLFPHELLRLRGFEPGGDNEAANIRIHPLGQMPDGN